MSLLKELMEGKGANGKPKLKVVPKKDKNANTDIPKTRNHVAQHMNSVQNGDGAHVDTTRKPPRNVQKKNFKKELKDQGY